MQYAAPWLQRGELSLLSRLLPEVIMLEYIAKANPYRLPALNVVVDSRQMQISRVIDYFLIGGNISVSFREPFAASAKFSFFFFAATALELFRSFSRFALYYLSRITESITM